MDKIKELTVDDYLKKMAVCDFLSPACRQCSGNSGSDGSSIAGNVL